MSTTSYTDDKAFLANNLRKMVRDARLAAKNMTALRKDAYKSAQRVINIKQHHLNELLLELANCWPGHKDRVEQWTASQFKPYITLGGDYREALASVERGITLKRFMAATFILTVQRSPVPANNRPSPVRPVPPAPAADATPEQQVREWKTRSDFLDERLSSLQLENKQLRQRVKDLEQENARLKRKLQRYEAIHHTTSRAS